MNMLFFAKTKFGLLLLSSIISAVLFVGAFEIAKNIQYYRWKANFDNYGWFGKITMPSPNPVLMWEYRSYGKIKQIKTNRYGFRDLDYESTAKPDNTFRIAFAGDSATLGMGVIPNLVKDLNKGCHCERPQGARQSPQSSECAIFEEIATSPSAPRNDTLFNQIWY